MSVVYTWYRRVDRCVKRENATASIITKEGMQLLSSNIQQQQNNQSMIGWRRNQILELSSKGYNQTEIAKTLQIDKSIVSRDLSFLRQQSRDNIRKYVDEKLPEEYEKCLVGLNAILKESWMTAQKAQNEREKLQALNLVKECYSMKMDMLTNATVIDDAIRFISINTNQNTGHKKNEDKESVESIESEERLTINQIF